MEDGANNGFRPLNLRKKNYFLGAEGAVAVSGTLRKQKL